MKQIVRVWRGDLRRVTASVVAIVKLSGNGLRSRNAARCSSTMLPADV